MFGWRKKHPLPKVPGSVIPTFKRLCRTLSESELKDLRSGLDLALSELNRPGEAASQINLKLAGEIASRCYFLLDYYSKYGAQQQALIVGAVAYFAIAEDAMCDRRFLSGLEDDARVVNYVLEQLGIKGKFIELH